eukprot:SAG31_NODE_30_length_32545_cov_9.378999_17_plen_43_part_00
MISLLISNQLSLSMQNQVTRGALLSVYNRKDFQLVLIRKSFL